MLGRRRDALPVIDQIGHACSVTPAKAGVWRLQSARLRHEIPAFAGMTTMRRIFVTSAPTAGRRSEEHTSELQSLMRISYAVFCLKKKKILKQNNTIRTCIH